MGWENMLGYMFLSLFIQRKVATGQIFMMALQKIIGTLQTKDCKIKIVEVYKNYYLLFRAKKMVSPIISK